MIDKEDDPLKKFVMRSFLRLHTAIYRLTNGKIGGNMGGNKILLLNSIGRKSGKTRVSPLVYIEDNGRYVLAASNGGGPNHPGWYYNLLSTPNVTIELMGKMINVVAEMADEAEHKRLWAKLIADFDQFRQYQEKTERKIQLFILTPEQTR